MSKRPIQHYQFECVAASFSSGDITCTKGYKITLPEGHPRLHRFQNDSFKETRLPLNAIPEKAPTASPKVDKSEGPSWDDLANPKAVKVLQAAGYAQLSDLASVDDEALLQITGIGPATVAAIRTLVPIEDKTEPPDGDDNT